VEAGSQARLGPDDRAGSGAAGAGRGEWGACRHCGSAETVGWGTTRVGWPRRRCRRCRRTFSAVTGTAIAGIQRRDKFRAVVRDMLEGPRRSCRRLAAALELDRMTVWHWRRRVMTALAAEAVACGGSVGAAATHVRESRKASREWVRHEREPQRYPPPDRPRWWQVDRLGLPLPGGMARHRVPILLKADTAGRFRAERADRGSPNGRTQRPTALPYEGATMGAPHPHPTAAAPAAPSTVDDDPTATLTARFHAFLRPFRGPATRYLDGYTAWFSHLAETAAAGNLANPPRPRPHRRQHDRPTWPSFSRPLPPQPSATTRVAKRDPGAGLSLHPRCQRAGQSATNAIGS